MKMKPNCDGFFLCELMRCAHERLRGFSGYLSQCNSNLFICFRTTTELPQTLYCIDCYMNIKKKRQNSAATDGNYKCVGLFSILRTQFSFSVSFILSKNWIYGWKSIDDALHATLHCCYAYRHMCIIICTAIVLYTFTACALDEKKRQENFNDTFTWRWILKSHTLHTEQIERREKNKKTNK